MTLIITGPHPVNTSQVVLPSPRLSNTEGLTATVQTINMMDGSLSTFVKRKRGRKRFRWEFSVGHLKAKELEDYYLAHSGKVCTANWDGAVYFGWLTLNPLDMRGEPSEFYSITLEFEEKK